MPPEPVNAVVMPTASPLASSSMSRRAFISAGRSTNGLPEVRGFFERYGEWKGLAGAYLFRAAGAGMLVGTDTRRIVELVSSLLADGTALQRMRRAPNPFGDGRTSERVAEVLQRELGV